MRCTRHKLPNCSKSECRRERDNREPRTTSTGDDLTDPLSPLHQTVYGGTYYGSDSGSSSDCGSSSSSSGDSGSSSYDSGGSSSSSCDSGSSY